MKGVWRGKHRIWKRIDRWNRTTDGPELESQSRGPENLKGEHDSNAVNFSEKVHNPEMANFLLESGINTLLQLLEIDLNYLKRNFECEREEARDRESRYIKPVANLAKQFREQNEHLQWNSSKLAT